MNEDERRQYKTEWARKKREKMKEEMKDEKIENETEIKEPDPLSLEPMKEEKTEDKTEKTKEKKKIKENITKPPEKKKKKKGDWRESIPLNPDAFANMSVGLESLSLQLHTKDKKPAKDLTPQEEQFIRLSATQLAEVYEIPKFMVLLQYGTAMIFPHVSRIMDAHSEKIELENEKTKLDIEEKKRKIEEGRKTANPETVYKSVMGDQDGNKSN